MTGSPGADPLRERLQARLGAHYEIESLLGQGGMGSVYRARDTTLDRAVAIKVIGGDVTTNPELRERFLMEARTVAKMRHPNLVAVYSAGDADGLLYFVMELVPGESLRDLLTREGKVEPARAERILHELALALDYAHANGVVHRDVKPENILLDRDTGRAMLTDFGVARALEGDGRMTGTGMILGSPRYMSPEQASGEQTLDGRSDLYALALVGYEMFTGKPVVESANIAGMLVKHLTETPPPLADAVPGAPEGTAVAIDRALLKDREQRWATGREMADVIGMAWTPAGITTGAGTRTGITSTAARTQAARKRGMAVAAAGVVAAIALAGAAWALFAGRGADMDPRRSYAVMPFDVQSGNAEVQWLRDGALNMLTLALGQWSDLQVADYERTLVLVREAGLEERRVDLDRARDIARKAGAGTVVMGLISTPGDSLLVDARLYDVASGEALNRRTLVAGLGADPRPVFDDLARYLLDVAGGSSSASVEIARATTSSIEAYRAYLDGVRLLQSWRLQAADSAFQVAIRADSTFALAWHKRALALGWASVGGSEYVASAQRAADLSERLPAREQALVRGHLALARAFGNTFGTDSTARSWYRESARIYGELLATDSLAAEAWYGLGDAYFHDVSPTDSLTQIAARFNRSIGAFHRTLQLDSTFHLAYAHLVQQYQQLSQPNSVFLIDGDTVRLVATEAQVRAAGGPAGVAAIRERARVRGLEMARGWVKADPGAAQAYNALAQAYVTAQQPDSAVATVERALQVPEMQNAGFRLFAAAIHMFADDVPTAFRSVREALDGATPASMQRLTISDRIQGMISATTIAGAAGNVGAARRVVDLFATPDSGGAPSPLPPRKSLEWYLLGMRLALGAEPTAALTDSVRQGLAAVESYDGPNAPQLRSAAISVAFVSYLATRDTAFSQAVRRLSAPGIRHTDLDALEALARGDTAAARTIAADYTSLDSLRTSGLSMGGMRAAARAEVLANVGDIDRAIGYYEAISPTRMGFSFIEPGFAVYTRTYAARARLYEERGDRDKAIAAWQEFLRRTEQGDESVQRERTTARAAVRRLQERGQ